MNDVSGIGSTSAALALTGSVRPPQGQQPDRSRFLENLFATLDTNNQGYFDKNALASAVGRIEGSQPGSSATQTNVDDLFAKLDTNGDGKVTKQEFSDVLSKLDDQMKAMRIDHLRQSPRSDGDTAGMTQDQIAALATKLGPTDSGRAAVLRDMAENFSVADIDGDGRISPAEGMKYAQSRPANGVSGAAVANKTDKAAQTSTGELVVRQLAQLLHAYGTFGAGGLMHAVTKGLSAIA